LKKEEEKFQKNNKKDKNSGKMIFVSFLIFFFFNLWYFCIFCAKGDIATSMIVGGHLGVHCKSFDN